MKIEIVTAPKPAPKKLTVADVPAGRLFAREVYTGFRVAIMDKTRKFYTYLDTGERYAADEFHDTDVHRIIPDAAMLTITLPAPE